MQNLSLEETDQGDNTFQEVIHNGTSRVCGDCWTDSSNKTVGFQNKMITQQSKIEEIEMEMKGTSIYPKPLMKGLSIKKIM